MLLHIFKQVYANLPLYMRTQAINFNEHGLMDLQEINGRLDMLQEQLMPFKLEQDRLLNIAANHLIRIGKI